MPSDKIIQLRQALAEKFPHLRAYGASVTTSPGWATGLARIDHSPYGGLPKGALTELIADGKSASSATVVHALMERAAREQQIITLVDGNDSLDVTQIAPATLARLLWIRARTAVETLKALDLVLRDQNLGFVIVDLAFDNLAELRRIPNTTWYRFQRLLEDGSAVCVIVTPQRMVLPARLQITLHSEHSLAELETERATLLASTRMDIAELGAQQQFAHRVA